MIDVRAEFNLTFDELRMTVSNVIGSMNRDATEFAERGVTAANITAFEAQGNIFEVFPSDNYYQSFISEAVQDKITARKGCEVKMRKLSGYVQQEWGLNSPKYKRLGMKDYQTKSDASFLYTAREVARTCEEYLPTLSTIGMTQAQIDALETEAQLMEDKMNEISAATETRDEKTQERVIMANSLYSNLRKYCDIGKLIWEDVDEAKYNDYVIYKTIHSGLPKVQNLSLEADPIIPTNVNMTWDPVVGATEYDVYQSQVPAGAPSAEFSKINTVLNPSDMQSIVGGFRYYFKVRATNGSEIGTYSDEEWIEA